MTNYKTINTKQAQIQQVNEFVVKNKIKQITKAKKEHISISVRKSLTKHKTINIKETPNHNM